MVCAFTTLLRLVSTRLDDEGTRPEMELFLFVHHASCGMCKWAAAVDRVLVRPVSERKLVSFTGFFFAVCTGFVSDSSLLVTLIFHRSTNDER